MKRLTFLLLSVLKPFLFLGPCVALLLLASEEYREFQILNVPGEILFTGLAGFWAARRYPRDHWRMKLLSAVIAAGFVAVLPLALGAYLDTVAAFPPEVVVGRAAVAGATGAFLSRLLHQRVTL